MNHKLSAEERRILISQLRKEKKKKICDRIKAVLAYDEGYSYTEISKILLLDDETIRRHIADYFSQKKVAPENGGSSGYLTNSQKQELTIHLKEKTTEHVQEICE